MFRPRSNHGGDGEESYVCAYSKDIFDIAEEIAGWREGGGYFIDGVAKRDAKFFEGIEKLC